MHTRQWPHSFVRSLFVSHRLSTAIFIVSLIFSMSSMTFISHVSFFRVSTISIYYGLGIGWVRMVLEHSPRIFCYFLFLVEK